jgi:hypothetical protein
LWIFTPSVTQKSRLPGLPQTFGSTEFAGEKTALQAVFRGFMREAQQTPGGLISLFESLAQRLRYRGACSGEAR